MTKSVTDSRYDVLKFILAIMIVILHTTFFPAVFLPWARLAVPIFFILSAYFFFRKVYRAEPGAGALRHFATRSALLYLFWFVLLIWPTDTYRHYFADGILHGLGIIGFNIVLGSTFAASWFIPAGVIAMSIMYALRKHPAAVTAAGAALYVLCCSQAAYYNLLPGFNGWFTHVAPIWSMVNSFPAALVWIGIGAWAARREVDGRHCAGIWVWCLTAAAGLAALWAESRLVATHRWARFDDCYLTLMIACPALFMLVRALPRRTFPGSIYLRHASVIFYCLHATIARLLYISLKAHHVVQPASGITNFAITMGCIILAAAIIIPLSRLRPLRILRYAY